MKRAVKTLAFLSGLFLLSNSIVAQHMKSEREQSEIKRLLKSLESDLAILRSTDANNFYNYISYGDIPSGKIAVVYAKVDTQLAELKQKWSLAEKVYPKRTKKIVKALTMPASPKKPKSSTAKEPSTKTS